jgi:hypothetical protein
MGELGAEKALALAAGEGGVDPENPTVAPAPVVPETPEVPGGEAPATSIKAALRLTALKFNEERREATGLLARPFDGTSDSLDVDGEAMTSEDVFRLARSYMLRQRVAGHDDQHDRVPGKRVLVEVFVNDERVGSPLYPAGAAVCTMRYLDDEDWAAVRAGERNGFSYDADVSGVVAEVEVLVRPGEVRA